MAHIHLGARGQNGPIVAFLFGPVPGQNFQFKFDMTESEDLIFGTRLRRRDRRSTGPNGNLFLVSLTNGTIYEVMRR